MRPTKFSVSELFSSNKQYTVPLYQRPYVWNRERQWEPLWEDVASIATALLEGQAARPHFLGAVVLAQRQVFGRELQKLDVIDGQQRLTTLQVLLAALRDTLAAALEKEHEVTLASRLGALRSPMKHWVQNEGLMAKPDEEQHKVWPTNADRAVFTSVMTAGSSAEIERRHPLVRRKYKHAPEPLPQLVEAYRYFAKQLQGFAAQMTVGAALHPFEALYQAFQVHLQVVVIELETDDNAQAIFESLNAHGAPLRASDLIRNQIFSRASAQGDDPDALYAARWRHFDEVSPGDAEGFWRREVKQGRLRHPRFELFFQHYLTARTESEVSPIQVFQAFRDYWRRQHPEPKVADELARIERFSEVFRWFYEPARMPAGRPLLRRFLQRVRVIDTTTFYPLLLWVLAERGDALGPEEVDGIAAALESYLVRAWICMRPAKNFNRVFLSLMQQLRSAATLDAATVRAKLIANKTDTAWPDDAAFELAWLRNPAYEVLHSHGVQMVLGAIHAQMLTSKQEAVTIQGPLTVEHVMPRSWRDHWPLPAQSPQTPADAEPADARRDRLVQTFGNLTLLTQPLNSAVSNGAFVPKRDEYHKQSLLRLNTYFHPLTAWDEDAIVARGKALFAHAKAIWPYGA